jgi:hypothetical protein
MASRAGFEEFSMNLNDFETSNIWLKRFAAFARSKKLQDTGGTNQITDAFLAKCSLESYRQVEQMFNGQDIEKFTFKEISAKIQEKIKPKKSLIIYERTKFLSIKQKKDETLLTFLDRLRKAAKTCDFSNMTKDTANDEKLKMRLVDGLDNETHKKTLLNALVNMDEDKITIELIISLVQQIEAVDAYTKETTSTSTPIIAAISRRNDQPRKSIPESNCNRCGYTHNNRPCPALGKTCIKCQGLNHFAKVCRNRRNANEIRDIAVENEKEELAECWNVNLKDGKGPKVREFHVNKVAVKLLMDSGSDATIITPAQWDQIHQANRNIRLKKCCKVLTQFDGSRVKLIGEFEGILETETKFIPVNIIVADVKRDFGLIGNNILSFSATVCNITDNGNARKTTPLGKLKHFEAEIKMVPNAVPSFRHARHLPIHLNATVKETIDAMIQNDILEKVDGGSAWASPIVVVKSRTARCVYVETTKVPSMIRF